MILPAFIFLSFLLFTGAEQQFPINDHQHLENFHGESPRSQSFMESISNGVWTAKCIMMWPRGKSIQHFHTCMEVYSEDSAYIFNLYMMGDLGTTFMNRAIVVPEGESYIGKKYGTYIEKEGFVILDFSHGDVVDTTRLERFDDGLIAKSLVDDGLGETIIDCIEKRKGNYPLDRCSTITN